MAQLGGITKSSKKLCLTQSALSYSLKFYEEIHVNNTLAMKNIVLGGIGVGIFPNDFSGVIKLYFGWVKSRNSILKIQAVKKFLIKKLESSFFME